MNAALANDVDPPDDAATSGQQVLDVWQEPAAGVDFSVSDTFIADININLGFPNELTIDPKRLLLHAPVALAVPSWTTTFGTGPFEHVGHLDCAPDTGSISSPDLSPDALALSPAEVLPTEPHHHYDAFQSSLPRTSIMPTASLSFLSNESLRVGACISTSPPPAQGSGPDLRILPYDPDARNKSRLPAQRCNVLVQDAPMLKHRVDKQGRKQGSFGVFGTSQRIRAVATAVQRTATARTISIGACQRCKSNHLKCVQAALSFLPCARCILLSQRLRQPCIRDKIGDIHILGKYGESSRWFRYFDDFIVQKIAVGEGQHPSGAEPLNAPLSKPATLNISQIWGIAIAVDVTSSDTAHNSELASAWAPLDHWGAEGKLGMPQYYISDTSRLKNTIHAAVCQGKQSIIRNAVDRLKATALERQIFQAAFRYYEETGSQLVSGALGFWAACRVPECDWFVSSGHPPGIEAVPHLMQAQLESAARDVVVCIGSSVMRMLDSKMSQIASSSGGDRDEDWLEMFLAVFVILSDLDYAFTEYSKGPPPQNTGVGLKVAEGFAHSCKTILAHFHFVCKGARPLMGGGYGDAIGVYLGGIHEEIEMQQERLGAWRQGTMFGTRMYWTAQLMADWRDEDAMMHKEMEPLKLYRASWTP